MTQNTSKDEVGEFVTGLLARPIDADVTWVAMSTIAGTPRSPMPVRANPYRKFKAEHAKLTAAINQLITKAQIRELERFNLDDAKAAIAQLLVEARIDTAETALRACPTRDDMLRVWLKEHIQTLKGKSELEEAITKSKRTEGANNEIPKV